MVIDIFPLYGIISIKKEIKHQLKYEYYPLPLPRK